MDVAWWFVFFNYIYLLLFPSHQLLLLKALKVQASSAASKFFTASLANLFNNGSHFFLTFVSFQLSGERLCSFSILSTLGMCFFVAVGMAPLTGEEHSL